MYPGPDIETIQMRKGILFGVIIVLALVTAITAIIALTPTEEIVEPPTLHVGDEWVYQIIGDNTYIIHYKVTAEGMVDNTDCYLVEVLYTPPLPGGLGGLLSGENMWMEKGTGFPIKEQISGEYIGAPFIKTLTCIYHSGPEDMWPLKVGREVTVTATVIENSTFTDHPVSRTETITLKVEKREDITVPAGTFTCFKIVFYDEYGSITTTRWYSDEVKFWVKTGEAELISYSIQ